MTIKVRVNKTTIFDLAEWNAGMFSGDPVLQIISDDLRTVKEVFQDIELIEIYKAENLVGSYTSYDGYSDIQFLGSKYAEHLNMFVDVLAVRLTKLSLVEDVERIKDIVEPVVDLDSMDLTTLKEYKKSEISRLGSEDIYAGDQVTFKDGTTKTFTFGTHDQQNLQVYLGLIGQADNEERKALLIPYHAIGEECTFYNYEQIVTIFFTLQLKLLDRYTRVNMLRLYIDSLDDIEIVKEIGYDTPLPEEYEARKAEIVQASIVSIMELKKKYGLDDDVPPEDEDEEIPVDNEEETPVEGESNETTE